MGAKEGLTKDEHTIKEHFIQTEDKQHNLYVQEWGSPIGVPILYLHGGPGVGCQDKHKNAFNPIKHRVIFFDQRGCGLSRPFGSLKENNTQKLVKDIEQIRKKIKIDTWSIHGRSWGSTLALCYAILYPESVSRIVTGGVWLATKKERAWLENIGYKDFYPELWGKFSTEIKNIEFTKIDSFTYSQITYPVMSIDDRSNSIEMDEEDKKSIEIELEYIRNDLFLPDNYILENADKLNMKIDIVQGRFDMVCPPVNAYNLDKSLKGSELYFTQAGHSGGDRENFILTKALLNQITN